MSSILCLETSSSFCSVSILHRGEVLSRESEIPLRHAEVLQGMIKECTDEAGIKINQLDAVALSHGPGSYTGLRIGAALAKGICFASDIPLIPIDTLYALAKRCKFEHTAHTAQIWAMIDARRNEVFQRLYSADLEPLNQAGSSILGEPEFFPVGLLPDALLCGDGALKASALPGLRNSGIRQHAGLLTDLASDQLHAGKFADPATYEPTYFKLPNITGNMGSGK